jgi:hypothetical protein
MKRGVSAERLGCGCAHTSTATRPGECSPGFRFHRCLRFLVLGPASREVPGNGLFSTETGSADRPI